MTRLAPFFVLLVVFLASACTTSFQQLQTSYAPHDTKRAMQVYPRLKGEACTWKLFGFIGLGGDRSVNAAVARMTRGSAKIDNLIAVQVEESSTSYVFVSKVCTQVAAYPVVYKDNGSHLELFETNMMAGRLVKKPSVSGTGTVEPTRTPTPTHTTTRTTTTTRNPVAKVEPVKPREEVPSKAQCEGKCSRFAGLWPGSDAIRSTIRGQCVKKCLKPENAAYRECIDGARKMEDISKCNSM